MFYNLSGLGERGLMTPSYLSMLVMLAVLPAKLTVEKNKPLVNDEKVLCTQESLFERYDNRYYDFDESYKKIFKTHTLSSLSVDGLETLEAKQNKQISNPKYEIFCCGNAQDAMDISKALELIETDPSKNYIFWNYPGVGLSKGAAYSTQDLFKAGYKQAKRLIDDGILAEDITLHGFSLGGGVAIHVARCLHEEGHFVNLKIDRSFARIALVPPGIFKQIINQDTSKQPSYAPFITSTIAFAISCVALGTTFAGFIASVGLVAASVKAAIGYCLAYPFNLLGFAINEPFSTIASFIDNAVNLIGSIVGGVIAIGGLMAGGLVGLVFGAFLSIQLLWTEEPFLMPMTPAFSAGLYSSCCEMDSVNEMHRLLNIDDKHSYKIKPYISVINVLDDEVIDVDASLSVGLGLRHTKQSDNEHQPLKEKITSFWYREGGHGGELTYKINSERSRLLN